MFLHQQVHQGRNFSKRSRLISKSTRRSLSLFQPVFLPSQQIDLFPTESAMRTAKIPKQSDSGRWRISLNAYNVLLAAAIVLLLSPVQGKKRLLCHATFFGPKMCSPLGKVMRTKVFA